MNLKVRIPKIQSFGENTFPQILDTFKSKSLNLFKKRRRSLLGKVRLYAKVHVKSMLGDVVEVKFPNIVSTEDQKSSNSSKILHLSECTTRISSPKS